MPVFFGKKQKSPALGADPKILIPVLMKTPDGVADIIKGMFFELGVNFDKCRIVPASKITFTVFDHALKIGEVIIELYKLIQSPVKRI